MKRIRRPADSLSGEVADWRNVGAIVQLRRERSGRDEKGSEALEEWPVWEQSDTWRTAPMAVLHTSRSQASGCRVSAHGHPLGSALEKLSVQGLAAEDFPHFEREVHALFVEVEREGPRHALRCSHRLWLAHRFGRAGGGENAQHDRSIRDPRPISLREKSHTLNQLSSQCEVTQCREPPAAIEHHEGITLGRDDAGLNCPERFGGRLSRARARESGRRRAEKHSSN